MRTKRSGVSYAPELSWALTAHWWGIEWKKFAQLTGIEQSYLVAVYESSQHIDSVLSEAQAKSIS